MNLLAGLHRYHNLVGALCVLCLVLCSAFVLAAENPQISIDGGPAVLRDNVRQYLTIADENCSAPEWRLKALLNDAQAEIEKAAQAVGFYQLTYVPALTLHNNCWQLHLELTPGPQVEIKQLNMVIHGDGVDDPIFRQLYEDPGIRIGERLNHGAYDNLKNRIATIATSHGYFDGAFDEAVIKVDVENNSAIIDLTYNTGIRYRIGEIRLKQNIFEEQFIQRYLNFKSGDYYDTDKLLELKGIYNATNYFNIATASPDLQHLRDGTVDVDVILEERKRRAYSGGVGIATDTGPRIRLGFEDRYVNDVGHSIDADGSTSKVKTNALVTYTIPLRRPSYEFLKIYTGYEEEDTDTVYSNKKAVGTSYSYYQDNHWLHTYAISIENETSGIGDENLLHSRLVIPSVTYTRTESDGNPYPLRGWSFIGRLSGSPKTFGSDVSFIQGYVRVKYIHAFSVGRLLLRSELGATQVDDFDKLPASVRFFAGGDNSVRGYDYKSLGPKSKVDGKVIGGNNLWVNSVEYDYLIKQKWAVATFYDIGNAADDFHLPLQRGVGVGARYISPIGPVRIDIARALDAPNGWNLHISMGPDL